MKVKKYQGVEMPEILERIRQELGPDAVVLSTRKIQKGNNAFGMFSRPILEVTAAADLEETVEKLRESPSPSNPYASVIAEARRRTGMAGPEESPPVRSSRAAGGDADASRAKGMFLTLQADIDSLREELTTLGRAQFKHRDDAAAPSRVPAASLPDPQVATLTKSLKTLEDKIDRLVERTAKFDSVGLCPALKRHFTLLEAKDLDAGLLARIFSYLQDKIDKGEIREGQEERALCELMGRTVRIAPEEFAPGKGKKVWAFVGPTGVGKTTTVAKLAARFALQGGKKVGLITVDTFRIAAVEQLKTYAGIMDVPLRVALDAADFKKAVDDYRDYDVVLVDTAGQSPRDEEALAALLETFPSDVETEIHLVLSITTRSRDLEKILRHYTPVRVGKLVLTKLDETECVGPLLFLPVVSRLPLAYLTTGQNVPDDIEPATPEAVVAHLMGEMEPDE